MAGEKDATVAAAFERFVASQGVGLTSKRLLGEFLAYPGPNGRTLGGLIAEGSAGAASPAKAAVDLVYIARKFFGQFIIKHYYVMRQYKEASGVALAFLKFLRSEGSLPPYLAAKDLDAAIQIGEEGVAQLPHVMRIVRQPDALNEAWGRVYPLRPFPLCTVPCSTEVKTSSSRHWPAVADQSYHAWLSYASERCRVEPEELDALVASIPRKLTVVSKAEGRWEVLAVQPDHKIVFQELGGSRKFTIPFTEKRAADFLPGMVLCATFVTLSDGTVFVTDWGYIYPTFYAPRMDHEIDFGPFNLVQLVY